MPPPSFKDGLLAEMPNLRAFAIALSAPSLRRMTSSRRLC
jgi:hypothetical protein